MKVIFSPPSLLTKGLASTIASGELDRPPPPSLHLLSVSSARQHLLIWSFSTSASSLLPHAWIPMTSTFQPKSSNPNHWFLPSSDHQPPTYNQPPPPHCRRTCLLTKALNIKIPSIFLTLKPKFIHIYQNHPKLDSPLDYPLKFIQKSQTNWGKVFQNLVILGVK